ncbi:hypothetical protein AC578_6565 [Pseudocercospora eumusae]|uniref:Uncharacterized protein n=1 Tax=Pseudocercospora eumusae TaxID=321146 RepID=A0A139HHZ8_9PEZI|nr:hypothetical protein AC578_6565 [Pseudocercospora eumusae]
MSTTADSNKDVAQVGHGASAVKPGQKKPENIAVVHGGVKKEESTGPQQGQYAGTREDAAERARMDKEERKKEEWAFLHCG